MPGAEDEHLIIIIIMHASPVVAGIMGTLWSRSGGFQMANCQRISWSCILPLSLVLTRILTQYCFQPYSLGVWLCSGVTSWAAKAQASNTAFIAKNFVPSPFPLQDFMTKTKVVSQADSTHGLYGLSGYLQSRVQIEDSSTLFWGKCFYSWIS